MTERKTVGNSRTSRKGGFDFSCLNWGGVQSDSVAIIRDAASKMRKKVESNPRCLQRKADLNTLWRDYAERLEHMAEQLHADSEVVHNGGQAPLQYLSYGNQQSASAASASLAMPMHPEEHHQPVLQGGGAVGGTAHTKRRAGVSVTSVPDPKGFTQTKAQKQARKPNASRKSK